jgi:hypothetical protein
MERSDQNRALRDLDELVAMIGDLEDPVRQAIIRNRFSTGQRKHTKGELGDMEGSSVRRISDTTGENAVWDEMPDAIGRLISKMAKQMHQWKVLCAWLVNLAPPKSYQPVCRACGEVPDDGRLVSGEYDRKCYNRWVYLGKPDKAKYEAQRKAEVGNGSQ